MSTPTTPMVDLVPPVPQVRLHSLTPAGRGMGLRATELVLYQDVSMAEVRHYYRLLRKAGLSAAVSRMTVLGLVRVAIMGGGHYEGGFATFTSTATVTWR